MINKVSSNFREVKSKRDAGLTSSPVPGEGLEDVDVRLALIQALNPLGPDAVEEVWT